MSKRETGRYESTSAGGEKVRAFVPHALPPAGPPIVIEGELAERVRAAEQALGRLELAGDMVPSLDWFIYAFVRKEAVLSSQIEGTQATLMDLLNYEAERDAPRRRECPIFRVRGQLVSSFGQSPLEVDRELVEGLVPRPRAPHGTLPLMG